MMAYDASKRIVKLANNGKTWVEIGNLLENFKTNIMKLLSSKFDDFTKGKKKYGSRERSSYIFLSM